MGVSVGAVRSGIVRQCMVRSGELWLCEARQGTVWMRSFSSFILGGVGTSKAGRGMVVFGSVRWGAEWQGLDRWGLAM